MESIRAEQEASDEPWVEFPDADEDSADQWWDFTLAIDGPVVSGREVQPYAGGVFRVNVKLSDAFAAGDVPRVKFMTRIWHPFVRADGKDEGSVCHEFWEVRPRAGPPRRPAFLPRTHPPLTHRSPTFLPIFFGLARPPQQYYKQFIPPSPAAPTLRGFLKALRSLLEDVHSSLGDSIAVNATAMGEMKAAGPSGQAGQPFDVAAKAITDKYAAKE